MSFALTCFIHLSLFNFQGPFRRPLFRGDFVILPHRVPFVKTFSKTFFAFFFALLPVHLRGRRLTTDLTLYNPFPLLSRAFSKKNEKISNSEQSGKTGKIKQETKGHANEEKSGQKP